MPAALSAHTAYLKGNTRNVNKNKFQFPFFFSLTKEPFQPNIKKMMSKPSNNLTLKGEGCGGSFFFIFMFFSEQLTYILTHPPTHI